MEIQKYKRDEKSKARIGKKRILTKNIVNYTAATKHTINHIKGDHTPLSLVTIKQFPILKIQLKNKSL